MEQQRSTLNPVDAKRAAAVESNLEDWVRGDGAAYDSVVIVGGHGITTHTFAARLARDPRFAGNVVLAGPPKRETDRRLRAGVSLRASAADHLAYALGIGHSDLIRTIEPQRTIPSSTRQCASMAFRDDDGSWRFTKRGPWQMHRGHSARPVMYGFRNSRMASVVRDSIADGSVTVVETTPTSYDEARSLAPGSNPLIVNGTTDDTLLGNRAEPHPWGIIAAQVPFEVTGELHDPLQPRTTFAPLVRRGGRIDVGYYTPFHDNASPRATWYGIIARPAKASELRGAEREQAIIADELLGIGAAAGLSAVDPDETMGVAAVPGWGWRAPRHRSRPGTFELRRSCAGGIPAYYADGIMCGAMGGLAAAEAIIRGADPEATAAAALRRIRRWNYVWYVETTRLAAVADGLMRISVPMAMAYPHSVTVNSWASAA